jgi:hypothetical protein
MSRKRMFIPPLMFVAQVIAQKQVMEPEISEEIGKSLFAIDKSIKEINAPIWRVVLTPKEYGIMKLGKRNLKVARK